MPLNSLRLRFSKQKVILSQIVENELFRNHVFKKIMI
jgi:hypothetical protein